MLVIERLFTESNQQN